jgi:CHAD domain-containing protein
MTAAAPASETAVASAPEQARRFMLAALDEALDCLAEPVPASDENIHRLRKALKRARAALRLLRPLVPPRSRAAALAALREVAHAYASARDSASLVEALGRLARHHPGMVAARAGSATGRALRAGRLHTRRSLPDAASTAAARNMLRTLRSGAIRWKLHAPRNGGNPGSPAHDRIVHALRHTYRRARRAGRKAGTGATDTLHAWRKEVKVLHNALLALESTASTTGAARLLKHSARLGTTLGCEHDLAMLEIAIAALGRTLPSDERRQILAEVSLDRQRYLERALRESERAFKIRPRRLARELGLTQVRNGTGEDFVRTRRR